MGKHAALDFDIFKDFKAKCHESNALLMLSKKIILRNQSEKKNSVLFYSRVKFYSGLERDELHSHYYNTLSHTCGILF